MRILVELSARVYIDYTLYICTVNSYYVFGHRGIDKKIARIDIDREYTTVWAATVFSICCCSDPVLFLFCVPIPL